ncbi:hypothetical protein YC2023_018115 [Brassica napus]
MAPRTSLALFLFLNLLFFTYTSAQGTCPRNALQIGACTNVLNAIDLTLGNPPPPVPPCCSLIAGLADLEAAVCLCTALDVNVLGINVHLPIDISDPCPCPLLVVFDLSFKGLSVEHNGNVISDEVHMPICRGEPIKFFMWGHKCGFKVSARHGPSLELVMDRLLRSAWAMELDFFTASLFILLTISAPISLQLRYRLCQWSLIEGVKENQRRKEREEKEENEKDEPA